MRPETVSEAWATNKRNVRGEQAMPRDNTWALQQGHTILRKFNGGIETQTFEEFARSTIQDDQVAIEIAFKMIEGDGTYVYADHEPEFYEEFEIIDRDGLLYQLARVPE